ncbi:MAG: ABC transporter permease subunit [Candidatus Thorarchaeota archaeon]
MGKEKTVSGAFLSIGVVQEVIRDRSIKWWAGFIIVVGGSLIMISSLIGLAASSGSGFGVQVIAITIAFALAVLVGRWSRRTSPFEGVQNSLFMRALPILYFGLIAVVLTPIIFDPLGGIDLYLALSSAGVVLGIILLILYDGYPVLKYRGTPGFITMAGFLIVLAIVYMTIIGYWIVPYDPRALNVGPLLKPPQVGFPLGTTSLGQDLLSRTIAGGGIMLQVAAISVVVCFSIGVPVSLATSYRGGRVEKVTGIVMDSIFAFPGLVLAIAIAAMLGPGVVNMAMAIAVVYIPSYYRVVRSQVLTIKELPYVEAAVIMGAKDRDILFRYILPNVLPSAVVVMSINFADAVLTAAGLTFIGLGLPVNIPDWGWDLTFGSHQYITGAWWVITFPGVMIVILAFGFTLAGEGLNELLTPKLEE